MDTLVTVLVLGIVGAVIVDMLRVPLATWWNRARRDVDRQVILPTILEQASSRREAAEALLMHALHDPAWQDLEGDEVLDVIDEWLAEEVWNADD